jgi:excisionase family DNA binding protein
MQVKLLRIKDLAQLLDVTRQTVRNMIRDGRIPVKPIEGTKPPKWNQDHISAWLNNNQRGGE